MDVNKTINGKRFQRPIQAVAGSHGQNHQLLGLQCLTVTPRPQDQAYSEVEASTGQHQCHELEGRASQNGKDSATLAINQGYQDRSNCGKDEGGSAEGPVGWSGDR